MMLQSIILLRQVVNGHVAHDMCVAGVAGVVAGVP
jgi:hypothetical protein